MRIIMMTLQMYKQKTTYAREKKNFSVFVYSRSNVKMLCFFQCLMVND